MEIIKEGNLDLLKKVKHFKCPHCGSEFLADDLEYHTTGMWRNMQTYVCGCPTCYNDVYLEE